MTVAAASAMRAIEPALLFSLQSEREKPMV